MSDKSYRVARTIGVVLPIVGLIVLGMAAVAHYYERRDEVAKLARADAIIARDTAPIGPVSHAAIDNRPTESGKDGPRLDQLEAKVARLDSLLEASPERALELPLMRRDIDALSKRLDATSEQMKRENDRTYDLSKWLFGAIGVSLLSSLLQGLFRRKTD